MKHYEEEILKPLKGILGKSIETSPRWAQVLISAVLAVFLLWAVFTIVAYVRDRIIEQKRNAELNVIRTEQKRQIDALHDEAISIGNVPKESIAAQKKTLDAAYKKIKGPSISVTEQAAQLEALRAAEQIEQ